MTDIPINEDDLDDLDLEKLADGLGQIARDGKMDELIKAMRLSGIDPNDPAIFTTAASAQLHKRVTLEDLHEMFQLMQSWNLRTELDAAAAVVSKLEQLAREHTKMKDFSFAEGDWLILPPKIFDSINVALPKNIVRSFDETSLDIYAVRGRDFRFIPE